MWEPVQVPVAPSTIQLPDNGLEKVTADFPSTWGSATHLGDLEKVTGSCLQPNPLVLAFTPLGSELVHGRGLSLPLAAFSNN